MSKQTAVELFALDLYEKGLLKGNGDEIQELLEQAKQMEKEQIVDAYTECWMNDGGNGFHKVKEAESYYNETYGDK
jgi:hypothetical protein